MRKLIIRVDATPTIGMGHAFRTAALIESLRDSFDPVLCGTGDKLDQAFHNVPYFPLEEALKDQDAIILVDHPEGLTTLPKTNHPKIVIDDFGELNDADIVLNGTVTAGPTLYPEMADSSKLLLGPGYALLRQAFGQSANIERQLLEKDDEKENLLNAPKVKPGFMQHIKNYFVKPVRYSRTEAFFKAQSRKKYDLLIMAGSGEKARAWVAETTALFSEWNIALVVGAQFQDKDAYSHLPCFQNLGAEPLTELMRQSKLAVVTGGMVLYECMAAGVPVVAFPSVDNMLPEIERLEDLGIIDNMANIKNKPQHLRALLTNKEFLRVRAEKGMNLVDGLGTKRAAEIIKERFA